MAAEEWKNPHAVVIRLMNTTKQRVESLFLLEKGLEQQLGLLSGASRDKRCEARCPRRRRAGQRRVYGSRRRRDHVSRCFARRPRSPPNVHPWPIARPRALIPPGDATCLHYCRAHACVRVHRRRWRNGRRTRLRIWPPQGDEGSSPSLRTTLGRDGRERRDHALTDAGSDARVADAANCSVNRAPPRSDASTSTFAPSCAAHAVTESKPSPVPFSFVE